MAFDIHLGILVEEVYAECTEDEIHAGCDTRQHYGDKDTALQLLFALQADFFFDTQLERILFVVGLGLDVLVDLLGHCFSFMYLYGRQDTMNADRWQVSDGS